MKTKSFNNKLVLNKKTLTHLDNGELNKVKAGGIPWIDLRQTPTANCI